MCLVLVRLCQPAAVSCSSALRRRGSHVLGTRLVGPRPTALEPLPKGKGKGKGKGCYQPRSLSAALETVDDALREQAALRRLATLYGHDGAQTGWPAGPPPPGPCSSHGGHAQPLHVSAESSLASSLASGVRAALASAGHSIGSLATTALSGVLAWAIGGRT